MYEPDETRPSAEPGSVDAARAVAWLGEGRSVEEVLQQALTGPADERDVTLARMGDILQATAQGLSPRAAAVWAGVPEPVLQTWIEKDPAFAAAFAAARALASAHATCPGKQHTPAMLRAMLVAMSTGATMLDALKLAGFSEYRFRLLSRSSPVLESLLAAARSARPSRRSVYVPGTYRPRRPGRKPPPQGGFRLVRRSTSRAEPEED